MEDKQSQEVNAPVIKSQDFGRLHKWLSEHKILRHFALHLVIAGLSAIIFYLQKKDKEEGHNT